MRKLFLFLFMLSAFGYIYPQTKYMIYFKDKGVSSSGKLSKTSELYKEAEKELSPRAIERRKQVLGDNYITYQDIPIRADYIDLLKKVGLKIENQLNWFNAVSAYLTDEQVAQLKNIIFIDKIEPVRVHIESKPQTEKQPDQSLMKNSSGKTLHSLDYGPSIVQDDLCDIPVVHDLGFDGSSVWVGILDSGFRWKVATSLSGRHVEAEHDFVQNDDNTANENGDSSDQDSHGTAVFSILGGYSPGHIIGPAYGATFFLAKTEYVPTETRVEEDNYAAALEWLEGKGVDITTSSLGYSTFDNPADSYSYADMNGQTTVVAQAVNTAISLGVTCFTSAGNEGNDPWHFISSPADAFGVIAVGAVDSQNQIAPFSSRGPSSDGRFKPEITAMGVSDYHATTSENVYQSGNGTSYAAPIAAGVGVLLKSAYFHLTNVQIRNIILESGKNSSNPNNDIGWGLVSALRAITYPNLEKFNGEYRLHKIFADLNAYTPQTAKIFYNTGDGNFTEADMVKDGQLKFYFDMPAPTQGNTVEFYFTYPDANSNTARDPEEDVYRYTYGELPVYHNTNKATTPVNGEEQLPSRYDLSQNYPNPFNPSTVINYSIPEQGFVSLKVYDLLGREVASLAEGYKTPGNYKVQFNGSNLASGVYFYRLSVGQFSEIKKMMLLK